MSEIFVEILGASLSTGILIAVLLLLSPLVNQRYAAKWRFWIWAVIAVRLLIPISGFSSKEGGANEPQTQYSSEIEAEYRQEQTFPRVVIAIPQQLVEPINRPEEIRPDGSPKKAVSPLSVISAVWAAGAVILFAGQLSTFLLYKRKMRKHGCKLTEGSAYDTFISLRREVAPHGRLELIYSPDAPTPMIMGYLRPIMVLPRADYTQEQMSFIIKHELIHFKRRDIWVKLLMAAAVSLHWFNPLVWLMRRRADVDMELSVDDGVVANAGFDVKKAYTEAIYSTIAEKSPAPSGLSTGFAGGKKILKKRFLNIMTKFNKKSGAVLLIAVAVLVVIVGAVIGFSKIPDSVSDVTPNEEDMNPPDTDGPANVGDENEVPNPENPEPQPQPEPENTGFTVPDGYTEHQTSMLAAHLEKPEGAPSWQLTAYETDNYLSVRFALPENWNFDGFSVADDENGKALGIGNPFPADDYDPDFLRQFPVGTELPKDYTPVDGEAGNVRVLEEGEHEWSPEEPYLFRSRSIVSFMSGDYENSTYIVRDGEWCMYVNFIKTDPDDSGFEERCENILRTVTIAQIVTLNQTISVSPADYASGEGREFDLNFWLLDGMSVLKASNEENPYLYPIPNGTCYIYNADGAIVGAVSFDKYEPENTRNERDIFAPIASLFDVEGTYRRLISNETYEIATVTVRRDGKENFGILSYNTELNVYVAFDFDSEMIDKEDVEAIASLVRIEERW